MCRTFEKFSFIPIAPHTFVCDLHVIVVLLWEFLWNTPKLSLALTKLVFLSLPFILHSHPRRSSDALIGGISWILAARATTHSSSLYSKTEARLCLRNQSSARAGRCPGFDQSKRPLQSWKSTCAGCWNRSEIWHRGVSKERRRQLPTRRNPKVGRSSGPSNFL